MTTQRKRVAVLISGRGSNMTALIESAKEPDYPAEIVGVISDKVDAPGLHIAEAAGIATKVLERRDYQTKEAHDLAIDATLHALGAELVCLAGYMRLLTTSFVREWQGRMINIHPALLPLFRGLDTHRKALEAGVRLHGCSVHFVTAEMDGGPIIAQAAVPVLPDDSPESLSARVLKAEHRLYPMALRLVAEGKARIEGDKVRFEGMTASPPEDWALFSLSAAQEDVDVEALARFTP
ncbi:phosphoribosylglycinamide formyltransferase [Pseudaminobacter sp. 19-2017]|uniref:Phosphoribosylglycinamide formyltransferase n=1 Tax=Pseudaminobacter soli (ex Zhang et al. 2022) TaxID=2831468 RepID=A0A942DYU1_9HYPH|nr:phosphoribosylglycinamide formyltransferase [Pseudaminobacter soli]MBS3647430.1 phosphoribosylglycinamide formyltransferase [Pseudaminobacter soli]